MVYAENYILQLGELPIIKIGYTTCGVDTRLRQIQKNVPALLYARYSYLWDEEHADGAFFIESLASEVLPHYDEAFRYFGSGSGKFEWYQTTPLAAIKKIDEAAINWCQHREPGNFLYETGSVFHWKESNFSLVDLDFSMLNRRPSYKKEIIFLYKQGYSLEEISNRVRYVSTYGVEAFLKQEGFLGRILDE